MLGAVSRRRAATWLTTLPNGAGGAGRHWVRGRPVAILPPYDVVYTLAVWGSDLYAGGEFIMANDYYNVAKWNGSSWSGLGSGPGGCVFAMTISGNALYAGGDFPIAVWNGSSWSPFGVSGWNGAMYALAASGSDLYAGGNFTMAGNAEADHIAKYQGFGSWSALRPGLNNMVFALTGLDTDLYA